VLRKRLIVIPRTFDTALSSLCMPGRRLPFSPVLPLTVILIIFFQTSPATAAAEACARLRR